VVQEAYVQGICTRSVDELVQAMGMSGISKSQVSRLCGETDDKVQTFLNRPLEGDWPYVWLDATYVKVRQAGRIVSVAVHSTYRSTSLRRTPVTRRIRANLAPISRVVAAPTRRACQRPPTCSLMPRGRRLSWARVCATPVPRRSRGVSRNCWCGRPPTASSVPE
jgi:hypothetical protein